MTDAEKKSAVLVALVKEGIIDLNSIANGLVERLPEEDFDPNETELGGELRFVGIHYVYKAPTGPGPK